MNTDFNSGKETLPYRISRRTGLIDTHPKAEKIMIEGMRRLSPSEKMHLAASMFRMVEGMALADTRKRHPEADEWECRLRVASRRLPAELMKKAFGWDVEEKGY